MGTYELFTVHSIEALRLKSAYWNVGVLLGKGGDLFELSAMPVGELLLRTRDGLSLFKNRNLQETPLRNYNELYFGGWQDLVPHRAAVSKSPVAVEATNGACVAWRFEDCGLENGAFSASISARLTAMPLRLTRRFVLDDATHTFLIRDSVENTGQVNVQATWTHHIAFGGDLLRSDSRVILPRCDMLDLDDYHGERGGALASLYKDIRHARDDQGRPYDLTVPPAFGRKTYLLLVNPQQPEAGFLTRDNRVTLRWDPAFFPYVRYWAQQDEGQFTVALEPSNALFHTMEDALAHNMYVEIKPGRTVDTWLSIHVDADMQIPSPAPPSSSDG